MKQFSNVMELKRAPNEINLKKEKLGIKLEEVSPLCPLHQNGTGSWEESKEQTAICPFLQKAVFTTIP